MKGLKRNCSSKTKGTKKLKDETYWIKQLNSTTNKLLNFIARNENEKVARMERAGMKFYNYRALKRL